MIRITRIDEPANQTKDICQFLHTTFGPENFDVWWGNYKNENDTGKDILDHYGWKLECNGEWCYITATEEIELLLLLKYRGESVISEKQEEETA